MIQLYPDQGLILLCRLVVHNKGEGFTWALFDNDVEPTVNSELGDFNLANVSWGRQIVLETAFDQEQVMVHNGAIQAPKITFTNDTGISQTVYGYLIFDQVTQKLIAAARFDDAPLAIANGASRKVQPIIGDYSDVSIPFVDGGQF